MSADGGYALIYRRVLEDPDFATAAEALAFVYLILKAAWRDCSVRYKGRRLELKRGQLALSIRDMASDLEWSKSRCDRFILGLKKRDKIGTDAGTGVTVVTICKYSDYQAPLPSPGTPAEPRAGQQRDSSGTQNNKENERKEDSDPEGSGDKPPADGKPEEVIDPVKAIFDLGVALLVDEKTTPAAARSLIGRWRKDHGDGLTFEALTAARARSVSEPKEWITASLRRRSGAKPDLFVNGDQLERKYANAPPRTVAQ